MDLGIERTGVSGGLQAERVLVCLVDDGLFGLHLDWVEAVYESRSIDLHRVRVERGEWHHFLLHRGQPALVVDLRDAFDVSGVIGSTERLAYVIVRSGGYRLALAIDQVSGVQDLDLGARPPVASNLLRDGGIPVGHVVHLDDRMLVVLDPHRLLSGASRDALEPIWARAGAYAERQEKLNETWKVVCSEPSEEGLRVYSRLCSRNGRPKAAAAAKAVIAAIKDPNTGIQTNGALPPLKDQVLGNVVRLASSGDSGILTIKDESGSSLGTVYVSAGRVIDAQQGPDWGRLAFKNLLAGDSGMVSFTERDVDQHPERISESSEALLVSSLEAVALEQRKRRVR